MAESELLDVAAQKLADFLRDRPFFTTVGTGTWKGLPALFLYVTKVDTEELDFLRYGWQGYHVEIRKMSSPKPSRDTNGTAT